MENVSFSNTNPCDAYLSDKQFLEHMIPHHQVAVEISYRMNKYNKEPIIGLLCRNIIWSQKNQIWQMKMLYDFCLPNISNSVWDKHGCDTESNDELCGLPFKYYYPCSSEDAGAKCDVMFFDPSGEHTPSHTPSYSHNNSTSHHPKPIKDVYQKVWKKISDPIASNCTSNNKPITSKQFMEHMIPHHQVAVDMCKRLLKHTNNVSLIDLCNDIIRNQQYEIWYMNNLLKGYNDVCSDLIYSSKYEKCVSCDDLPRGSCFSKKAYRH